MPAFFGRNFAIMKEGKINQMETLSSCDADSGVVEYHTGLSGTHERSGCR
jgi:hypothetical protein